MAMRKIAAKYIPHRFSSFCKILLEGKYAENDFIKRQFLLASNASSKSDIKSEVYNSVVGTAGLVTMGSFGWFATSKINKMEEAHFDA